MTKWRILVIDDEASSDKKKLLERSKTYLLLEKEKISGLPVEVEFSDSLDDAGKKIKQGRFQFAIIDVVLQGWGDVNGVGFEQLLLEARKHMSVALVSIEWDISSIGIVRRVLNTHPECFVSLLLRWADLKDLETRRLITFQMQNRLFKDSNHAPLIREEADKIRILHLSDLHFGINENKKTLSNLQKNKIASKIKGHWKGGPDFIAVTGDISNSGHPDEYNIALDWFEWLAGEFGWSLPNKRILLVPGNHDVSIPISASRKIGLDDKKKVELSIEVLDEEDIGLSAYSFGPFQDFAKKLTGGDHWSDRPFLSWIDDGYRQHGLVFSGFNSCSQIGGDSWPKRIISVEDLVSLEGKILELKNNEPDINFLNILLSHHSPVLYQTEEAIENSHEVIQHLIESEYIKENERPPLLILHGHAHQRDSYVYDNRALVISAPTPSPRPKREDDNARGFTLIELKKNDYGIEGADVLSYIFDGRHLHPTLKNKYVCNKEQWRKST